MQKPRVPLFFTRPDLDDIEAAVDEIWKKIEDSINTTDEDKKEAVDRVLPGRWLMIAALQDEIEG